MSRSCDHVFVLPTLKISGGNLEVVRLAEDMRREGRNVAVVSLWHAPNPIRCEGIPTFTLFNRPVNRVSALLSLPFLLASFWKVSRKLCSDHTKFIYTHFTTYLLAPLVRKKHRWFFVQALEWHFVAAGPLRHALKGFIIACYRKGCLLTANRYLRRLLEDHGLRVAATADIWADPFFDGQDGGEREFDVALMFRKGTVKRADWGMALLDRLRANRPGLRVVAISPDEEFADAAGPGATFLLRPSRTDIRRVYEHSRVFVLFSDHEGFGLPPLEAMGSGCVPLCRDAGGIRAYMEPAFEANIIPLDAPPEAMIRRLVEILDDRSEWSRLSAISRCVFRDGLHQAAGRLAALEQCGFVAGTPVSP